MWVTTKDGFYSVVQQRDDPTKLIIRARAREDLERMCATIDMSLKMIEFDGSADYAWRVGQEYNCISRVDWLRYLAIAVDELDYDSHCKEEMTVATGKRDADRYRWYMGSWSGGHQYQRNTMKKRNGR